MKRKQSITAGCTKEVSGILKGLNEVVDDSRVVVETLLGAVGEVVDGHVMRKKVVSWFDEKGVGEEEDKKFSDGIANASEATPEMLSTVSFYNGSYVPSISGIDLCDSVGTWFLPTRVLWKPETITDLKGNCKMMLDHHNYGMPSLVVPFVLYSASQKGQRYVWSVWIVPRDPEQPGKWKSVKSAELEEAFSTSGGTFELDPAWFPKKLGLHSKHVPDDPITFTEVEEASHAEGFSLHAHFASRFVLVRYALKQRGAPLWSPVHDTISWLPTPNLDTNTFTTSMNTILPPGVIEYLYSREPSQPITWPGWEASYALGLPAAALVSKCFAEPNQQDYNKSLHEEVLALVDSIVDDNKEQRENIGNMLASWALNNNATIDVPHVDEELVRPMLRQIVGAKLGREEKPPPAMLAHCLEVQKVQWNGSIYLVALSGSNPLVTSTDGNVSVVSRMADLYDDQIFWQLNRAMRMKQFGVEPHLQVSAPDMKGNYYLKADVPNTIEECEGLAFQHDGGARLSLQQGSWTGCTHNKLHSRFVWFESGTWLLKQMLPLQYHIDKALKEAGTLKGSKAPPGLTTYRGLKDVALDRSIYDTGKVVLWGAYSSTSGDRGIAAAFAQTDGKAAVFSLTGKNCVCISKWSRFGREREWLYPPNSAFQVTSSLSEEHAELAGKKDLQIFSMNEVDEVDALIVYLRGLVNKVVTQANNAADEAKKMPRHVEQLFKVMLGLVKYKNTKEDIDLNTALAAVCDPEEQVLYTAEGSGLSRKLLAMGASRFALSNIARRKVGPVPNVLGRLVDAGAPFEGANGAVGWMGEFESQSRSLFETGVKLQKQQLVKYLHLRLEEERECRILQDNNDSLLQVTQHAEALCVSGLYGDRNYYNGYYVRNRSKGRVFTQVSPIRLLSYCEIHYDTKRQGIGEWLLTDSTTRALLSRNKEVNWLSGSFKLEGQWGLAGGAKQEGKGFPFVTVLTTNPQEVICARPDSYDEEKEEMLRLAKEPPLPRDRYSDEDEDEFEGDDGDSWFWEEAAQNVEKRPLKPVTTAVDQNMLKAPSMFRNSNRCELKASDWGGTGFGFEHSWRNENTRPLVVRAGFLRAVHGSGFKCGVFKSKKTSSNCVISKKTSKPLRHELKPWERERASVLKAYDALMAAAEESATPEVVQIKYQLAEKKSIAYRLFGLTENVHPSPVRELWQKDDTGAAMQEKIVEILEAADPDSLSFEQRLLMFPETIEALKRKTLLQMKPPLSPKEKTELPPLPDVTPLGGSRGIINIHIGQAGCQIGSACWELFCLDHEIGIDGYPDPEAHGGDHDPRYLFDERKNGKWRPRAVFVDMDPTVVGNSQEVSRINNVVLKENNVIGKQECGDNYADGYYSNKPMQAVAIDRMRKLFEACDVSLGVQITHSLGGGCGSGFGSAILHDLKEYTRRPIHCYTVMPSPKVSNGVTELYNWVLAVPDINEVASMCAMYDNESLYFATLMNMGMKDPKFTDMNRIIAQSLSSVTATIRLSSRMSLRSMEHVGTNLCPFPRTNFMTTAFAPLFSATKCAFPKSSFKALATMASAVLHPSGSLVSVDQRKGKAIATSLNFRGDVEPSDALAVLTAYRQNRDIVRVDYTPCDIKSTICSKLPIVAKGSAMQKTTRNISLLMNTTATGGMMQTSFKRANQLFCKRAFVHWYCRVGMEEGEFSEKFEGVAALIRSYEELGKEPEYEEEEEDYY